MKQVSARRLLPLYSAPCNIARTCLFVLSAPSSGGAKENAMKKFALVFLAVIGMAVLTGCRASGEIDPDSSGLIVAPR
jgi:hypothetical protein